MRSNKPYFAFFTCKKMDETSKKVLEEIGLNCDNLEESFFPREVLLSIEKYEKIKNHIPALKSFFSSSSLTSLHKNAETNQKFPLLNLVRQILHCYKYELVPVRKCDGYTKDGIKKYKRFFLVTKKK